MMTMTSLENELGYQDLEIENLEKMIEDQMQVQLYFKTGEFHLSKTIKIA